MLKQKENFKTQTRRKKEKGFEIKLNIFEN